MERVREDIMMVRITRVNSNKESVMDMERISIQRLVSGTRESGVLM